MADAGTPAAPPPPQPAQPSGQIGRARNLGVSFLLAVVTIGIYIFFWVGMYYNELKNYRGRGIGPVLGVIFMFIPILSIVNMFILSNEIEMIHREDGQEPPMTTIWGLWFLLPIIGAIIWWVRAQSSMNQFWISKGAQPA